MGATVGLILAGFCAGGGFAGVAGAAQPPPSVTVFGADGRPMADEAKSVLVKATGRVLDADTGRPLPVFFVTTGTQDRDRVSFDWSDKGRLLFTNGAFRVDLSREKLAPALLIEAEGYLPRCSGPFAGRKPI